MTRLLLGSCLQLTEPNQLSQLTKQDDALVLGVLQVVLLDVLPQPLDHLQQPGTAGMAGRVGCQSERKGVPLRYAHSRYTTCGDPLVGWGDVGQSRERLLVRAHCLGWPPGAAAGGAQGRQQLAALQQCSSVMY